VSRCLDLALGALARAQPSASIPVIAIAPPALTTKSGA
jgi:hypothetical protein